jgi:hypothetical protein
MGEGNSIRGRGVFASKRERERASSLLNEKEKKKKTLELLPQGAFINPLRPFGGRASHLSPLSFQAQVRAGRARK